MDLDELNRTESNAVRDTLFSCCGSAKWVELLMKELPFKNAKDLVSRATAIWYDECVEKDWLESFARHPKIGDVKSMKEKFAGSSHLAVEEQSDVALASQDVIEQLALANDEYESKFGFIFIVCATNKTAGEMLRLMTDRLKNSHEEELRIAMGEQHKITIIRLKKSLNDADWHWLHGSQLTTHVLDTSLGRTGAGITIKLQSKTQGRWVTLAQGVTNSDGRITDLLPPERILPLDSYKLIFDTGEYFRSQQVKTFYPEVEIQFSIFDEQHYHVPLLINPFGYSTYRGS